MITASKVGECYHIRGMIDWKIFSKEEFNDLHNDLMEAEEKFK